MQSNLHEGLNEKKIISSWDIHQCIRYTCNIWYIHVSYLLMKFDCNNCKSMVQLKSCKVLITILHMQHSFTFTHIRNNLHMLIIKFPITVLKEYNFKFKARHILLRESQNYKLVIKHIFSFS